MQNQLNLNELKKKLEHFCAYQERCHEEVLSKLRSLSSDKYEIDEVIVHLISNNYLNEERFAKAFARGKHNIKHWGKSRIVNELKMRNISSYNINSAMKEIDEDDYLVAFDTLAERYWQTLTEKHPLKKRRKFCDFLLRKGYETDLVYSKAIQLEKLYH